MPQGRSRRLRRHRRRRRRFWPPATELLHLTAVTAAIGRFPLGEPAQSGMRTQAWTVDRSAAGGQPHGDVAPAQNVSGLDRKTTRQRAPKRRRSSADGPSAADDVRVILRAHQPAYGLTVSWRLSASKLYRGQFDNDPVQSQECKRIGKSCVQEGEVSDALKAEFSAMRAWLTTPQFGFHATPIRLVTAELYISHLR